ncbi:MAG TPA: hypothetical protein ENJ20_02600, partial [Bacteroidetes bacterium]|nr:hypothetical protein [Bacteroidota bacterium]
MTAVASDCDGDNFWVTLNFDYANVGDEGFRVQGNGNNYGNFEYADLPIEIGPLLGDGVTEYEFVAIDNQFNDCSAFTVLGVVSCNGGGACTLYDLTLTPTDCDADGTYDLIIDFLYENPTHTHFDVIYQNQYIGFFALADLPVTIVDFNDNGENTPAVQVCINDDPDCCVSGEFMAPNCSGGNNCEIWDLEAFDLVCDGDHFFLSLNFNYANVGNDGFTVVGNGMNHGTFSYDDLPITLGPLPANGAFWEFLVQDVNHPDCSDFIEYGQVDCQGGGDCDIWDLVAGPGDCNSDGTYQLFIDFLYENPGNDFFEVFYEGDLLGTFPLNELPLLLPHFEDNGEPNQVIHVCINDVPDCCATVDFAAPDCNATDCGFTGFFAEAHPCND